MNKRFKILILLLIFSVSFVNLFAQKLEIGFLEFKGKITSEKKPLVGATVEIFKNDVKTQTLTSKTFGLFNVNLDFNAIYTIKISKEGKVGKKITVNTNVKETNYIYNFDFEIDIFNFVDGLEVKEIDSPVTKIVFDEETNYFDYDKPYTEKQKVEVEKVVTKKQEIEKKSSNNYLALADKEFDAKNYEAAIDLYDKALDADIYNDYADNQIVKCEALIKAKEKAAKNAGKTEQFDVVIAQANEQFDKKDYQKALVLYNKAINIDPYSDFADKRIDECEKLIDLLADSEKNYKKLISNGNNNFVQKKYAVAKTNFEEALTIKPNEAYPKEKLAEIDKLLNNLAVNEEQKKIDEQYQALIKAADQKLTAKDYTNAKTNYTKALEVKPNEQYPKTKIKEIDDILLAQTNKAKQDEEYNKLISNADKLLVDNKLNEAKSDYSKALGIKSEEQYPKTKIAEIDKKIADLAAKNAKDKEYNDLISLADQKLTAKDYTNAKTNYTKALEVKSNEQYPKTQIANIDATLAILAANQKKIEEDNLQYKTFIASADKLFDEKKYKEAKGTYGKALTIKENEQYPKDRISKIDAILEKENATAQNTQKEPEKVAPKPKIEELKFKNEQERIKYLSELALKYPDRKTVENYTEDNGKQTLRIIINNDGVAHEYRKIKQPWGDEYFFKDGKSISKSLFLGETK